MRLGIRGATAATNARISIARAVGVTIGLGAVGASVGAGLAAGLFAVLSLAIDGPGGYPYVWDAFWLAGVIGAGLGAIALPYVAWSLPRVAIGRIVATTALGTAIGGTAGFLWMHALGALLGAVMGFGCAASYLGIRSSTALWGERTRLNRVGPAVWRRSAGQ